MKFRKQRAIYLQIGDYICENILTGTYAPGEKISSVREMAVRVEVNPNTVMRSYTDLQQKEILYNQRGIGFFVADDAIEKVMEIKKREFLKTELPHFFKTLELLNLPFEEVQVLYRKEEDKNENKQ
jgi:DNA-binding transcriptional regulator YhcF (GntR family)